MVRSFCIASLLLLAACSGGSVKETLGLDSRAPDEFRVVSRPPLSVPPQFSLRPPSVGETAPNAVATDTQARALITGKAAPAESGQTFVLTPAGNETAPVQITPAARPNRGGSAESVFLQKAGAMEADPSVRKELVEESYIKMEAAEERPWWDWWGSTEKKEATVNAGKEAERIQQNQNEGKPVNEGETPVVNPKNKGVLGDIFGY